MMTTRSLPTTPPLEKVVADNVARLRRERSKTQADLAWQLRLHGLPWDRAMVAMVETGRRQVRLAEAVALCAALRVSMVELVAPAEDAVTLAAGTWSAGYLRAAVEGDQDYDGPEYTSPEWKVVSGAVRQVMRVGLQRRTEEVEKLRARWDLDPEISHGAMTAILSHKDPMDTAVSSRIDKRIRLNVTPGEVKIAAEKTWGRSFEDERERRASKRSGNRQAIRGRVTRELEAELAAAIEAAANRAADLP